MLIEYENKILPIIKRAGIIITSNLNYKRKVCMKGYANYVTDLDKRIESFIVEQVCHEYPNSKFITEESSNNCTEKSYWVLEPIDGTTNLIHGYKSVCISLAHIENGVTDFGIVYNPITKELFYAVKNKGAYLLKGTSKKLINVNKRKMLKCSIIGFGCPYNKERIPYIMNIMSKILEICDDIKRQGPASLDICYVACGRLSGYIELDLELWDFMAGKLILEEAGGRICNFKGEMHINKKSDLIVTNGLIEKELISLINQTPKIK